jgi:HPt (histidine-containing phosphotransfer) domain-containing protein
MARRDLTGAVNFKHLETYAAGDQAVVDEVLAIFREQASLWLRLLDPASEGWRDAAHTLKGSALGIGAFALADECEAAELADDDVGKRARLLELVQTELDRVLGDIAAYEHEQALKSLRSPQA